MKDNNAALHVAKLHWLVFFWPILSILVCLILGIEFIVLKEAALIFLIISVVWLFITWVLYQSSSLSIEQSRVIFRTGLLVRKTTDICYGKIESIDIRQSILGSMMGYGLLMVTGTGGTRHVINFVDKPLTCRRYIEQQMQQ